MALTVSVKAPTYRVTPPLGAPSSRPPTRGAISSVASSSTSSGAPSLRPPSTHTAANRHRKSPAIRASSPAKSHITSPASASYPALSPACCPAMSPALSPAMSPVSSRRPSLQGDELAISCFNCDAATRANIELVSNRGIALWARIEKNTEKIAIKSFTVP